MFDGGFFVGLPVDGVKEIPEPGIPTVGRIPRFPIFSVLPAFPMDVLIPPLLRFNRKPFPSLNIFRKRNGIISPNELYIYVEAASDHKKT